MKSIIVAKVVFQVEHNFKDFAELVDAINKLATKDVPALINPEWDDPVFEIIEVETIYRIDNMIKT